MVTGYHLKVVQPGYDILKGQAGEGIRADLGISQILKPIIVSGEEGEHSLVHVADLKHEVGKDLQELLHLEGGWPLMRLREFMMHRGIVFNGDGRQLGRHERGDSG